MSSYDVGDLKVSLREYVAQVEICRPPHNYFDAQLIDDLASTLERLDEDPQCRVTVLCAAGKSFCAGANFSRTTGDALVAALPGQPASLYDHAARIFSIRKPLIAAVQGPAIGGGLGLALAADFRIVSPDARFAANFVKIGTHAGFAITYTLPRIVGEQRANLLLYTGRRLNGAEAFAWGLADVLVEQGDLREAAHAFAREIAVNAPLAVMDTKATMRADYPEAVRRHTAIEQEKQARLFATDDHKEGVAAVAGRRDGNFSGR